MTNMRCSTSGLTLRALAFAMLGLAVFTAHPGQAAPVTVTATGTVASGEDEGGLFGPGDANIVGDPFTLVFTVDTANGASFTSASPFGAIGPLAALQTGSGVAGSGANSPVNAVLTIENRPVAFAGSAAGVDYTSVAGQPVATGLVAEMCTLCEPSLYIAMAVDLFDVGGAQTADYSYKAIVLYGEQFEGRGTLNVTSLTTSGVPEPATWGLMIAGLGMTGGSLRLRRDGKRGWAI